MQPLTQTSSNPRSGFIRAGLGDATRLALIYLIFDILSAGLRRHSHAEWHTCLRLPPGVLDRNTTEGTQCHPRRAPLSAHVRPLLPSPDRFHRRMAPIVSPSGNLCLASPSRYAPPFPIHLLSRRHQRRHFLSLRQRRSSTSVVSPLA